MDIKKTNDNFEINTDGTIKVEVQITNIDLMINKLAELKKLLNEINEIGLQIEVK